MALLTDPQTWISLLTLTVLEIVLGIDNVIFIAILAGKLPKHEQGRARSLGLSLALFARVGLLCSIFWLMKLTAPLFDVSGHPVSGKDLVLLLGGMFLLWKSVHEIHGSLEGPGHEPEAGGRAKLAAVVGQILVIDIVFSLDSVITAVGLAQQIEVMITAVVLALGVMLFASKPIGDFVNKHPSVKMLALAFLLMVGLMLVAEGMGQHIPKGYIYFAMAFSFAVEMLNLRSRAASARVKEAVESSARPGS
jgi:predicted tellurium resistance membrane protein TerC